MRNFDEGKSPKVPAIVLGRGYTGLGTLRSLAMAGIPAYVACPPGDLVTRSRWYRPLPGMGTPQASQLPGFALVRLERELQIPRGRGTIRANAVLPGKRC